MLKFKIECGWTVYKTDLEDVIAWGGLGICDMCGEFHSEGGYLVPVLNQWLCEKCYNDFSSRAKFYPEDVSFENSWIEYYESILTVRNKE